MKKSLLSAAILSFAALSAGSAFASVGNNYPADHTVSFKTRAEVRADLADAVRTGNIVVNGQTGLTAYQQNPSAYPARAVKMGKTRAQVRAELAEAVRTGNIVLNGQTGLTAYQQNPSAYPTQSADMAKARGQSQSELSTSKAEAGLMPVNGNSVNSGGNS